MEMLVTKFSNGKYRNEGELFDEPISNENVKLMGEMIALQTLRTLKKYDWKIVYCIGWLRRGADGNLLSVSVHRQKGVRYLRQRPQRKRDHDQTCLLSGSRQ